MNFDIGNFISALVGAFIGGVATFASIFLNDCLENERKKCDSNDAIYATLQAIREELIGLRKQYMETVGSQLESTDNDTPFLFYYSATEDYFTIYNQNASKMGQINDDALRANIVAIYIQIKSLLDTYKSNNNLLEKYNYYSLLYSETNSSTHYEKSHGYYQSLLEYLPCIKSAHNKAMSLGDEVITEITKYLNSHKKSS